MDDIHTYVYVVINPVVSQQCAKYTYVYTYVCMYVHPKQARSASPSERFQFAPLYCVHYYGSCGVRSVISRLPFYIRCLHCASKTGCPPCFNVLLNKLLPMYRTSSIVLRNCWTPVSTAPSSNFRTRPKSTPSTEV